MTALKPLEPKYTMPDLEEIQIRPIEEEDLPGLEWDGEYAHFRTLYQRHFASSKTGNTRMWVAVNTVGKVIGQVFVLLSSRQKEIADGTLRAYLFSFRIRPEYRGQGLGGYMLGFVENFLLLRGFMFLRLNVARSNAEARHMYETHGFRTIGPDPGVWSYEDQNGEWQTMREPAWKMIKKMR